MGFCSVWALLVAFLRLFEDVFIAMLEGKPLHYSCPSLHFALLYILKGA